MALASGTRLGPYEVVGPLGSGGMGEVYRARDPRLSREVAVKLVATEGEPSPDRLRRFETEARAAAQLSHPNVVTVHDVGTHDGQPYLVLELLEGETLRETLRGGLPPLRQAVSWALEVSRGLAAAHERGIVHRDLKPENVFLTSDGRVKILDFGLAKLREPLVSEEADRESPTATRDTSPGVLLGTVGYMSPEQVKGETPDPRTDVFALGVLLYETVAGRRAFGGSTAPEILAAILRDDPPPLESVQHGVPASVETVVRRCLAKRPADRFSSGRAVEAALETVLSTLEPGRAAARPPEPRGPYPGLSSFTEADAERFFGRESEVEALWQELARGRLLAVIGPSGAGKTSFLRAGLVSARPSGWAAIVTTPGGTPMRALARALVEELPSDADTVKQLLGFDDEDVAFSMVRRWRESHLEAVLVVDQFEELFTLCPPEVQQVFAELLGRLAKEADVRVLLSLRDDFLMRCHEHEALVPVFKHLTPLGSLSEEGLRRAVTEPARKEGFSFEDDRLVEEILEAVEGARGALPLLAFAVARLWEKRDREKKLLTRRAYEEIGGVAGALAQHAEQTLERIGLEREPIVRELFRNLVTAQWTRAVADREQLLSVLPDQAAGAQVLDQLVDARLLTSYELRESAGKGDEATETRSRQRIEIVHESLLRAWPRLVRWQAQDEEGAVLRDQLKQAAHLWEEKSRSPDLLWSGDAFQEFELWRRRYPGKLTALEDEFAEAMAHRARRRKRLRRVVAASVVIVAVVVAAVTGALWWRAERSREQARREALRAEASKLLALAQNRLEDDPTEALALVTASLRLADTRESRAFAVKALEEGPPAREVPSVHDYLAPGLAFSPDGAHLSKAGWDAEVHVWREDGQGPLRLTGHGEEPNVMAKWASSDFLVTGPWLGNNFHDADATWAHVWSFPDGRRVRTLEFGERSYFFPGGAGQIFTETVESGPGEPIVYLLRSWSLPNGEPEVLGRVQVPSFLHPLLGDKPVPRWSLIAPGGGAWVYRRPPEIRRRSLPVTPGETDELLFRHAVMQPVWERPDRMVSLHHETGEFRIWSYAKGQPELVKRISWPKALLEGTRFWPDPAVRWILDSQIERNRQARLWSIESLPGALPLTLRRSGSWNGAQHAFHPGGDWIVASTHASDRVTFWPLRRVFPIVVGGYDGPIWRPVTFSHDGQWLVTHWPSEGIRLWPLPGSGRSGIRTLPTPGPSLASRLVLDRADRFLFLVRGTLHPCIVPTDGSPARQMENPSPSREFPGASVSPSGRWVASASHALAAHSGGGDKTLAVWDVETGERRLFELPEAPSTPDGLEGAVNSVHFLDDTTLYTSGVAGVLRWDLETGRHEVLFAAEPETEAKTEMSADGRTALARWHRLGEAKHTCEAFEILHPESGTREALASFGDCPGAFALDPSGTVAVTGDFEGVVRVGRLGGGEPHLLFGHEGSIDSVAISPDLRWLASTGEDNTLRLWPMPDLDEPPLHTLPRDELLAKLRSLTNLRAVRDPNSSTGWTIELGPFPGWREVPTW